MSTPAKLSSDARPHHRPKTPAKFGEITHTNQRGSANVGLPSLVTTDAGSANSEADAEVDAVVAGGAHACGADGSVVRERATQNRKFLAHNQDPMQGER